jgi:hypothetical protein
MRRLPHYIGNIYIDNLCVKPTEGCHTGFDYSRVNVAACMNSVSSGQYRSGASFPDEVAGSLDHPESNNSIEKRVGDLAGGGHWGDGIELAHADQRRTADVRQLVENVERGTVPCRARLAPGS